MKIARIVIIFFVLLTAAITVGDTGKRPVSSAITRAADCCTNPVRRFALLPPGQHKLDS